MPLVVSQFRLRGHVKDKLQNDHEHQKRQRRALALQRPRTLHGEIILGVQHEGRAEIALLQDDQNIIEDERSGVRKVHVLGQRRGEQPHACPQRAGEEEQHKPQQDIRDQRLDRVFPVDLDRREHEEKHAERRHDTEHQRKPAGDRRADALAEDIARYACPRQVWFQVPGLDVVRERSRIRDRRKDRHGEQNDVARKRFLQQFAVIAIHYANLFHAEHGKRVRKRADQKANHHAAERDQKRPSE